MYKLVFLTIVFSSVCWICDAKRRNVFELDPELADGIEAATPEFASSLKRRFTNVGVSQLIRSTKPAQPFTKFDDIFIREENNQVTLRKLAVQKFPVARLNEIVPNLAEKFVRLSADWYNIVLTGYYETSNISQISLLPVHNVGKIEIVIENIRTRGLSGFSVRGDALATTTMDLDFEASNVTIQVEYIDNNTKAVTFSSLFKRDIDDTIMKHIKRDLFWRLQETLRERLDHVLLDFSLGEIFNENTELSAKYRARGQELDDFINKLIDKLILSIRDQILLGGYSELAIPDFTADFSHKIGLITFWGGFSAEKGFFRDISSIKRTAQFSMASDDELDEVTIFGALGLGELLARYDHWHAKIWNIGPSGDVKASCGANSIKFRVVGQIHDLLSMNFTIREYDIKVVQLENIEVKATGLGFALNWLLSQIATWLTGIFKQDIIGLIESNLKDIIETKLPKGMYANGRCC